MADKDDVRSFEQIKAYPRGQAQGGRALQAMKGNLCENDGTSGYRTVVRETPEGRATGRTRDGMPMVEVEGGCLLGVDHGIADPLSASPLHPDAYKSGKLYRTTYVAAHITGAAEDDPYRPIVDEIEPPDNIKGTPLADGATAPCLKVRADNSNAGDVYDKKVMMARCPPSVFTGRVRLWIQAIYGRQYEMSIVRLSAASYTETPSLVIGDTDPVTIHTSCGIFYEAATGKHWLICVGSTSADIYPLEAENCEEDMRSFLTDPDFPAADKERVETYILSASAPSVSKKQTVTFAATGNASMGYGWHFNWDGDRCDIVHNDIVSAPSGGNENQSTHYRLTFAKAESGAWSVTRTIVEGPVRWKSLRYVEPIAYPDWSINAFARFGAHLGPDTYGNAPFYVFYVRNTLKVCRYSATSASHSIDYSKSPWYYNPAGSYRLGGDAVDWKSFNAWTGKVVTISCGGDSVSYESGSKTSSFFRATPAVFDGTYIVYSAGVAYHESSSVTTSVQGYPTYVPSHTISDPTYGPMVVQDVVGSGEGGTSGLLYATDTFSTPTHVYLDIAHMECVSTEDLGTRSETRSTQFISAIPFNDAEAIYLHGEMTIEGSELYDQTTSYQNGFDGVFVRDGGLVYSWSRMASSPGIGNTTVTGLTASDSNTQSTSKLVCGAGAFSGISMPGKSGFWSVSDNVFQQYPTYTSASGQAVKAPSNSVDSGNSTETAAANYVGWA